MEVVLSGLSLPTPVASRSGDLLLRRASREDVPVIMRLLSDDPISSGRGDVANADDHPVYAKALDEISDSPGNELMVLARPENVVVGMLQLTLIPGMARRGSTRLLVEAVRIASEERSVGIGGALMRWVVERAAIELHASLVQLTSDAARTDAHRFYRRLGFTDSHLGFKYSVQVP